MKKITTLLLTFICVFLIFNTTESQTQSGAQIVSPLTAIEKTVGEEVIFTLTMKDQSGDIIRGWSTSGTDVKLVVSNSTAETDNEPLTVLVLKDLNGNPLTKQSANTYIVSKTLFVEGQAQIIFMTTKADTGIYITATPAVTGINNISSRMNYHAAPIQNFLVEIVPAKIPNIVYVLRRYELRITPRDQYNNINTAEMITSRFTARYPGEFNQVGLGAADIFAGDVFIQGPMMNYFLLSTQMRSDQVITCYKSIDKNVFGSTNPYEIANHAPAGYSLISPPDNSTILIKNAAQSEDLTWQDAIDPYTNIDVDGQKYSDTVTYKWIASSLTGAPLMTQGSNKSASAAKLTFSGSQLENIITQTTGMSTSKTTTILWRVEATDGIFTTRSNEEWKLTITKDGIEDVPSSSVPSRFELGQNYPNPFNPTTSITFDIPQNSYVSLKVYDLLGNEIATLVNKNLEAGSHSVIFDAKDIPSGTYLYKLKMGLQTAIRKMTVLK